MYIVPSPKRMYTSPFNMTEESRRCNIDNDDTYDHIVKYTGLFGGVQGLNMLIGIVRNKITASLLGPSGSGLINIYNKVIGLVNQATNFGLSFSAVKHIAELSETTDSELRNRMIDTVRMWCLMTAMLGMFVGMLLSPWISWWTFRNYDYTQVFVLLSSIVAMMAITGGEIAILKGLKQLKKVALISVFAALGTLLVCVPFYYLMGVNGIVSALVISNVVVLGIHLYFSSKVAPWRKTIATLDSVRSGMPMIKLGLAYLFSGIMLQSAELFINTFILNHSNLEYVGLYNTGFFLITYVGSFLFTSVEADFFPRLSALVNDIKRRDKAINQQIEVCVLLTSPCIILEVIAMPLIVQLLYTEQFAQSGLMATYAIFYLFFKAMTLPVAYLSLANGDSKTFFIADSLYAVFIAIAIPFAFARYGLIGAGVALSLASILDLLLIHIFYRIKYEFRLDLRPVKTYVIQFLLVGICVYAAMLSEAMTRWALSLFALLCSTFLSLYQLQRKTTLIPHLLKKRRK